MPRPLSFEAFGSFVAKRMANAGYPTFSPTSRILVAITKSPTSCVESPVAVTRLASGAAGLRLEIDSVSNSGMSSCSSAVGSIPKLIPTIGMRNSFLRDPIGVFLRPRDLDAAFKQDAAGANGLGILGEQRSLLGGCRRDDEQRCPQCERQTCRVNPHRAITVRVQNSESLSAVQQDCHRTSLTRCTCIMA